MPDKNDLQTIDQALINANIAIFTGELIFQSTPVDSLGGNYSFSKKAMDGLAYLCASLGHACLELEELYNQSQKIPE